MDASPVSWEEELEHWLEPFRALLSRPAQKQRMAVYLKGLVLPGERKSLEPMAARVAPGELQQLHHFLSTSPWPAWRLEDELIRQADALLGGPEALLVIDDTALVKQGKRSVGVARQYCGHLGKKANCQVLVSLTLARDEVPLPLVLRLFLPDACSCPTPGPMIRHAAPKSACQRAGSGLCPRPSWRWRNSTGCSSWACGSGMSSPMPVTASAPRFGTD